MVEMKKRRWIPEGFNGKSGHSLNDVFMCMCVEEDSRIVFGFLLWENGWNTAIIC